jgi:two-component sensor histidine kinase/streptogramin lyase
MLAGLEDQSGGIWLGGRGGLLRWQDGQPVQIDPVPGWSNVVVRVIAEDSAGNIYVGTSGKGLLRWRGGEWRAYSKKDGLGSDTVAALYIDAEDTVWIGTWHGGLSRFKEGRFFNYSILDGLPSNCVGSITEDDHGHLWFGSNRGLFRIQKQQLTSVAEQGRKPLVVNSYGMADGLSTLECVGGAQPTVCNAPDGNLWFATVRGVAVVNPGELAVNRVPPPVIIEEVTIDEEALAPHQGAWSSAGSGITVPAGKDRLELRFTGLSFGAPERIRFRYRLDGLDAAWVDAGTSRKASYAHLPPGRYRFHVTACSKDGVWNEAGTSLAIAVLPPWWMTWWFRVAVVLGTGGVLFWLLLLRWRRMQHERSIETAFAQRLIHSQEGERKRIAAELHDCIGQNLLAIKNWALLGLRSGGDQSRKTAELQQISEIATQSIEEVREICRNLRPHQIDRLGITKAIELMTGTASSAAGLRCDIEIGPVDGLLAQNAEIHFYRIIQELLSNIIKHSYASSAFVFVKPEERNLVLRVEDDGRGFDFEAVLGRPASEHGMGLSDIAERVKILGGKLQCDSRPGAGARWRIEVPMQRVNHEKHKTEDAGCRRSSVVQERPSAGDRVADGMSDP